MPIEDMVTCYLKEFASKWKNSKDFYLKGNFEPTTVHVGDDIASNPVANNADDAQGKERKNKRAERENEVTGNKTVI
ncbi:hypothetical protein J1N35_012243 [Gossypium stocksii]|uniref:Uncharacterized protein n=1 Tax=Gossypium stocksii TaxID=47602 RepID=A0A9D3W5Z5_9ROSI|nr:hypothetical protein J1N35_012243 [Gossypium stocksii]